MHNRLLLLTAAVVLSACADDQHPTAPVSRSASSSRSAAGDLGTATQSTVQAKPIDQVGFTKITTVVSALVHTDPGQMTQAIATCPAGSTAIGGGYSITLYTAGSIPPLTRFIGLDGQNGWKVFFSNEPVGSGYFTYYASVYCAS